MFTGKYLQSNKIRHVMLNSDYTLFTPGPTQVPAQVLRAIATPPMHHRSDEFRMIFKQTSEKLRYVFQTNQPVIILTCSGTGALESTVVNLFSPGETVLVVNNGRFSDRWIQMIRTFGIDVREIKFAWGKSPTCALLRDVLLATSDVKGVYLTHCETSTGAFTNVGTLAAVIHENSDALVCVDGVSSIGAIEFYFDKWEIDAAITASQKALMCPPGLACVALSDRAISKLKTSSQPKFYFDLNEALLSLDMGTTPWTPSVSLIAGLFTATEMIRDEGISDVWKRHQKIGSVVRNKIEGAGFKIFPECPCDSVTVASFPPDLRPEIFLNNLKTKKGMILGRGQGEYKNKLIRVGHMGWYSEEDINLLFDAIKEITSE